MSSPTYLKRKAKDDERAKLIDVDAPSKFVKIIPPWAYRPRLKGPSRRDEIRAGLRTRKFAPRTK